MWYLIALFVLSLVLVRPANACVVGDLGQPPSVTIISTPPPDPDCNGWWENDQIVGTVNNVETDSVKIVLYAWTNQGYVQPWTAAPNTTVNCDGTWSNGTHCGHRFCAILCKKSWIPPNTLYYLPPVGGEILAETCVPTEQRRIQFAGYVWDVKSNLLPLDPGPNYFSDSMENVWVDDNGRLHLRLNFRDGKWYCSEVYSDQYFSYGVFRFVVEGPVDSLDPNVVMAGFVYYNDVSEADIEFSRWRDPNGPNGQYVIQPWSVYGNRHRYPFSLTGTTSTHQFAWSPTTVTFGSYDGPSTSSPEIEYWIYSGPYVPSPMQHRFHFNLWLIGGQQPSDSQEVEIVVSSFSYTYGVDVADDLNQNLTLDPVRPNPHVGGIITVHFTLPNTEPAQLELLDVAGRRVAVRNVGSLGVGRHTINLVEGMKLSPGLYFVRLTQGIHTHTARVVMIQ